MVHILKRLKYRLGSQGSVLGPLEFLIYINNLPLCIKHSNDLIFADDCTLSNFGSSITEKELSEDVGYVDQWCTRNDMVLGIPKCNVMLISTKQALPLQFW